jgi:hypothetical protein
MKVKAQTIDINDLIREYDRTGGYFFTASTMRYFKSRVSDVAYVGQGGIYFVTSERNDMGVYPRKYTVRQWHPANPGTIDNASGFQEFASRSGAHTAANRRAGDPLPKCTHEPRYFYAPACPQCIAEL